MTDALELLKTLPDDIDDAQLQSILSLADTIQPTTLVESEADVKRLVVHLDRAMNRNQSLRLKHPEEPEKFMDSEIQLDEVILRCAQVAPYPSFTKAFIVNQGLATLCSLVAHSNTDILISVLSVLRDIVSFEAVSSEC
ncbi:MAG: uncharacterized protein KVP18_000246 [Porospora cf. gigantea A]|uniref:uncharacterized protein n=1 Tax=Porospora cf. gigantea A TaxID=2853593 RepID=UPI0035594D19|nr:MAG: hypothetical protein KVP18_000246 [Porospora cf. gigantea A]